MVFLIVFDGNLASPCDAGARKELVVHVLDFVADNDLVLAVCNHDLDDAGRRLDGLRVSLGVIFQDEAQSRDAVCDAHYVVFAAHIFVDGSDKF